MPKWIHSLRAKLQAKCRQQQGLALITTLCLVSLATLLVVALLTLGSQARVESGVYLDGSVADMMVDNTVELVKGQLVAATSQKQDNGLPRLWVSQPGAITLYAADGSAQAVQKLYSSDKPLLQGTALPSPAEISAADMPADWASQPDHFVDMNAPEASYAGTSYPILDPRLIADGVEGLQSSAPAGTLPMPVRWLYMLQDGTLGTLTEDGQFSALDPALTGRAKTQPILARIAYWVDDETCKINLNTASEGAYWDAPVADTSQERYLASQQPSRLEYARMPGHPAGVCLSSVLAPGQRFYPDGFYSPQGLPALSNEMLAHLWQLGRQPQKLDALAGREPTHWASLWDTPPEPIARAHRYATVGEAAFSPFRQQPAAAPDTPRLVNALFTTSSQPLQTLGRAHGLLTAQSSAPELTPYGTPRISTWPVHAQTLQNIQAATSGANAAAAATAEPNSKDTPYNRKAAYASLLQGTPYFLQRSEPGNGGADLEYNASGHNEKLRHYLELMTQRVPPGWAQPQWESQSLAAKYGKDSPGILLSALDYIRSTNLADGQLSPQSQFSILCPGHGNESYGFGQISPLQKRMRGQEYLTSRQTQSLGRICTVSEIALVINCRAQVIRINGVLTVVGDPTSRGRAVLRRGKEGDREIEVSLLLETFLPGHSWADYRPYLTAILAGGSVGEVQAYKNSASRAEFPLLRLNGQELKLDPTRMKLTSSNRFHQTWNGAGGSLGILSLSEGSLGFEPIIITATQPSQPIALHFQGGSEQEKELKLVLYDSAQSTAEYDLHQIIPLKLPDISPTAGLSIPTLPQDGSIKASLAARVQASLTASQPLLHAQDVVQSLLPLHGDYRLTASQRWLEHGSGSERLLHYCPHPQWGQRSSAHNLRDAALLPTSLTSSSSKAGPIPSLPYSQASDLPSTLTDPSTPVSIWLGPSWQSMAARQALELLRQDGSRRGSALPHESGDYDNGLGQTPDGPYSNRQDDGHWAAVLAEKQTPYFSNVSQTQATIPPVTYHGFNAQRLMPSPVVFGSLPTGTSSLVPWQTLLFRPQPSHYGAQQLPDHLLLELFYTPVLEPEPLSLNYETEGKINLNQGLLPFSHIRRQTALHALLKAETVIALPDTDAATYKTGQLPGQKYRPFIDAASTLQLWQQQLSSQRGLCRTASQVCELYLVPEGMLPAGTAPSEDRMEDFWARHRLTGDNSRERPYARLYPRLTTQSNSYRLHLRVQIIRPTRSGPKGSFSSQTGRILAERSGSVALRRQLQPTRPGLPTAQQAKLVDYRAQLPESGVPPLTDYYLWTRGPLQR